MTYLPNWPCEKISIYQSPPWLKTLGSAFAADIRAVETLGEGGEPLAITPIMIKKMGPFCLVGSPLSGMHTQFAGPLLAEDLGGVETIQIARSQHRLLSDMAHYIEWGFEGGSSVDASFGFGLESFGYSYISRPTILIDLSKGEQAVWLNFQGRARNMIRKAEKIGVHVRSIHPSEAWIDEYYGMLQATFRRQGRQVPHSISFYKNLGAIAKLGWVRFLTAEFDGRMVAGGIFILNGSGMLYLSGTANAEGMKLAATSLVQWCAMRDAISNGATEYDMGGLGVPAIDRFKRSFGGLEINHHRWVYRSRLFRILEPAAKWALSKGIVRMV